MATDHEKACLSCTLPICDDTSKECAYVQITRDAPRRHAEIKAALDYYYANRDEILAAAKGARSARRERRYRMKRGL